MATYRRMKHMEESDGASGENPGYGAIFMSSNYTRKESLRRELFGLPMRQAGFVKQVKAGMMLFLFEFESRELHGVFQACSDGALNIEPNAFRSSGKLFPAQVKFTERWRCRPLPESEFRHAIRENYFTATKFNFGLSKAQVQRLLKLFSFNKEDRSFLRISESSLRNTVGDRGFGNRSAGETDGDVDREFPFRVTSTGDACGRKLTENYGFGDESDIGLKYDPTKGNEYSGDTSDVNMDNSFGTDALTINAYNSLVNDRRVPKNLRHTASGRLENDYNEKYGIAQASSWSNNKERLNFEVDTVVPQTIPLDLAYGTNIGYYDPCDPRIMGDATMTSSRHDLGAPKVDLIGSSSFKANSNYGLGEEFIRGGGYVSDALPSETVQPFPDEHYGLSINTSSLGLDYYIPMPTEHLEYQTNAGLFGVARAESESEYRNSYLRHSQFPGLLTSAGATENIRKFERPQYPDHPIFPSFAYPSSSRDLSPKDGRNTEIITYQHQEDFGGHVSYTNDMVVQGSSIYPSLTHPSTLGDGADLYPENRTNNKVQAYQWHEEFGGDVLDSNNRVTRSRVTPAELGRNGTRESVFKRLSVPSKERDAEKVMYSDTESVDEVMVFLNDCNRHWIEQKRSNVSTSEDSGKLKKKREKIHTAEELDNDLMLPFTETTPDDPVDCEGRKEHSVQKLPFINFKRRSKAQNSPGTPTQVCKESPELSGSQNKKRKLLRPKLIEDDSEKDRENNDNPIKNVFSSEKDSRNNADPIVKFMASQSATEVPVHDSLGCNEGNLPNNRGKNDDSIENSLASQSATEAPVHDFLGRNEGDSEKDRGNKDNPITIVFASEKDSRSNADQVPVHDFPGSNEGNSQKNRGKHDNYIEKYLASQSATEVPVQGRNEGDSEKDRGNNDNPIKIVFASEKDSGNNADPIVKFLASQSVTEVPIHDFVGRNEGDSEKDRGKNDSIENFMASQSVVEVPAHDLLGRDEDDSEKNRGNDSDPMENVLTSQSATEIPYHGFLERDDR